MAEKYKIPIVVTGFEPLDLVQGIYMAVEQLEKGLHKVENQYSELLKKKAIKQPSMLLIKYFK